MMLPPIPRISNCTPFVSALGTGTSPFIAHAGGGGPCTFRIGHSRLTYGHIMARELESSCYSGAALTVEHFFLCLLPSLCGSPLPLFHHLSGLPAEFRFSAVSAEDSFHSGCPFLFSWFLRPPFLFVIPLWFHLSCPSLSSVFFLCVVSRNLVLFPLFIFTML